MSRARWPASSRASRSAAGTRSRSVIHNTGRAIVYSGHQELAEHYWEQLKGAGLTLAPLEQG